MRAVGAGAGAGATGTSGDEVRPRYWSPTFTPHASSASAVNPARPKSAVRFIAAPALAGPGGRAGARGGRAGAGGGGGGSVTKRFTAS